MKERLAKYKKGTLLAGAALILLVAASLLHWMSREDGSMAERRPEAEEVLTQQGEAEAPDASLLLGNEPFQAELFFAQFPFDASYEEHKEWIIKWREGYPQPEAGQFEILDVDAKRQLMLVHLSEGIDARLWYQIWVAREDIEYIRPNQRVEIKNQRGAMGLKTEVPLPRHLEQINAPEGWEIAEGSEDVVIAVLDTGIDLDHPLLQPYLVPGANLIFEYGENKKREELSPEDDNGHGTRVAGVIVAAENRWGYRGVLKAVKLMPVKVIKANGEGSEFDVAQGIYYAVDHGADIILLSAGFPFNSENMRDAVNYAYAHGVLVIAASGNSEARDISSQVNYPAAYPAVLAVGAVDEKDEREEYSNYGPELDVVAPGRVYTTDLGGGLTYDEGTSFAAPQVAALAALIMGQYPHLSIQEVRNHIRYTAQDVGAEGWDQYTGYGRIDVGKAMKEPPVKDIYPDHGTLETAAPLPVESVVYAELRNKGEQDVYYVDLPYPGTLQLNITLLVGKEEGVDLIFYPLGREEEAQTFTVRKKGEISIEVPAGVSYLSIAYNEGERRPTPLPYELVHTFRIYKDAQHPNHTLDEAFGLQNGQVVVGTFHEEGEKDWFYFDVPEAGTIKVTVSVYTSRLDPVLELFTPEGERIERDLNAPPWQEEQFLDVEAGRYYVAVSDWYANQVNEEYFLVVVFTPKGESSR